MLEVIAALLTLWLIGTLLRWAKFQSITDHIKTLEARVKHLERVAGIQGAASQTDRPASSSATAATSPPPLFDPAMARAMLRSEDSTSPSEQAANRRTEEPSAPAAPASQPESPVEQAQEPDEQPQPEQTSAPKTETAAQAPARDLETTLGSRWSVWVGGLALALGGIFLVRYSIDEGLLGPGLRIAIALVIGALAMAAGEFLRRSGRRIVLAKIPSANIPAILTATGITIVFGAIYAAYALYGFIDDSTTFILLAVTALGALVASLLHGSTLAALGLVGAHLTPVLVGSSSPDYALLAGYLAIVTSACLVLARGRQTNWIALAALVLTGLWSFAFFRAPGFGGISTGFHILFAPCLTLALFAYGWRRAGTASAFDARNVNLAILVGLAGAVLWLDAVRGPTLPIAAGTAIAMISLAAFAAAAPPLWRHLLLATGVASAASAVFWHKSALSLRDYQFYGDGAGLFTEYPSLYLFASGTVAVVIAASAFLVLRNSGAQAAERGPSYAFTAALTPVALLAIAALRFAGYDQDPAFAVVAVSLMVLLYAGAEHLKSRSSNPASAPAFAAGAAVCAGLFCTMALPGNWLHTGLAIASAGVAFTSVQRRFPVLATMSAMLAAASALRLVAAPPLSGVGETPILNDLLYAYGLPALAFSAAAWWLRKADSRQRAVHEALAAILGLLFVTLEIRHLFHGPDGLVSGPVSYSETVAFIAAALGLMTLFVRLSGKIDSVVLQLAALVTAVIAVLLAFWMVTATNPLFDGTRIDGPAVFNRLLFGYGLAAAAFAGAAWIVRDGASAHVKDLLKWSALALAGVTVLLILRNLFHGPDISADRSIWLDEGGAYVAILFAAAALFGWIGRRFEDSGWPAIASVVLLCAIAAALLVQGIVTNPFVTWLPLDGPPLLDGSVLGYLAPAIAAAFAAALLTRQRDRALAGFAALGFGFCYVLIQIRKVFNGPDIAPGYISNPESYTYSAAILIYGIIILGAGFLLRSREIRLASALVIVIAVTKVFLIDMAALEGIWRAMSFIGLGIVMMGIGLLYQRLLARPTGEAPAAPT